MVSYITQIFFVLGSVMGQNRGSNLPKRCLYPVKSQYKCYIWVTGHMRGWVDVKVTWFKISTKFTLFCEVNGSKTGVLTQAPFVFLLHMILRRFINYFVKGLSNNKTEEMKVEKANRKKKGKINNTPRAPHKIFQHDSCDRKTIIF